MSGFLPLSATTVIVRSEDPLSAVVDGEVILMSPSRDCYIGMNPTASAVWQRLAAPVRVADLVAGLQQDFDGPPEQIEAEVMELLARMAELDLLAAPEPTAD